MPVSLFAYETLCTIYGEAFVKMFYVPISITNRGRPAHT
jgi:hypothetical protein